MKPIKIFAVDDHKLFVEGMISLLSDDDEFEVVGYSLSANEFLRIFDQYEADVYLMDINMPEIPGTQLASMLKEARPEAKILALTMYDDYDYVEKMIRSGASGYILKSASIEELSHAIRTVANGMKYFGSDIQDVLFKKIGGKHSASEMESENNISSLTNREIEIISLIAQEYTTQQIAEKLFISERTVETHRKNIFSKTKAKSVIGLSKYAFKHGIVNLE